MSYYNRKGERISLSEFAELGRGIANKRLAADHVGGFWISTVWLGLDHSWSGGPPLIFETMAFPSDGDGPSSYDEVYCDRYSTEAEALAGHARAVAGFGSGELPE